MNRRLGIVASAGGSVIFEVLPYLRANGIELVVATDRACGIEERCAAQGILHQRFAYHERDAFSQAVQHFFVQHEVALVLLYYTRFVGAPLYDAFPTLNIHPSLLPQFTGLNPLARQLAAHVPLIGATLHQVDARCDGGPILAQIANRYTAETAERISFLQKIYLTLAAVDHYLIKSTALPEDYLNANLGLSTAAHEYMCTMETLHQQRVLA